MIGLNIVVAGIVLLWFILMFSDQIDEMARTYGIKKTVLLSIVYVSCLLVPLGFIVLFMEL